MAQRYYFSTVVQQTDPIWGAIFRAAFVEVLPGKDYTVIIDARRDIMAATGVLFITADVTDAEHATLSGDARITVVPFETNAGVALPLTATIGDVPNAKRTAMRTRLDANHIPTSDLTNADLLRVVVRRIVRRLRLREKLQGDDWSEGLDTLVSAVPAAKRTRIADKLQSLGYDTSVIVGSDTVREALRKLVSQNVGDLTSPYD